MDDEARFLYKVKGKQIILYPLSPSSMERGNGYEVLIDLDSFIYFSKKRALEKEIEIREIDKRCCPDIKPIKELE